MHCGDIEITKDQEPHIPPANEAEVEKTKKQRTLEWASFPRKQSLSDINEGDDEKGGNTMDKDNNEVLKENLINIPFYMAQNTFIQGSIWSKNELVTAINRQPDGFIVKNWKGVTSFIHNSLLKSHPNKNEELKEVNHNIQTFEKLTNEAALAKQELLQSQKIIQDLEKRFAEGESNFKTIDDRVQNCKKMEKKGCLKQRNLHGH